MHSFVWACVRVCVFNSFIAKILSWAGCYSRSYLLNLLWHIISQQGLVCRKTNNQPTNQPTNKQTNKQTSHLCQRATL